MPSFDEDGESWRGQEETKLPQPSVVITMLNEVYRIPILNENGLYNYDLLVPLLERRQVIHLRDLAGARVAIKTGEVCSVSENTDESIRRWHEITSAEGGV